jgi:hypothetical protein
MLASTATISARTGAAAEDGGSGRQALVMA